jgi:hypothetical protein
MLISRCSGCNPCVPARHFYSQANAVGNVAPVVVTLNQARHAPRAVRRRVSARRVRLKASIGYDLHKKWTPIA